MFLYSFRKACAPHTGGATVKILGGPDGLGYRGSQILVQIYLHTFVYWTRAGRAMALFCSYVAPPLAPHIERQQGFAFLCALWFIMGGQHTLYYLTSKMPVRCMEHQDAFV